MPTASNFIKFQNVWFAHDDELLALKQFAVEDINLQIPAGEFTVLVGPSGCGKSTLLRLATGLRLASTGSVYVDDAPVTGPLKFSGMAFQSPSLLPWRNVLNNVLLPLEIVEPYRASFKADIKQHQARAIELLHSVGLADSTALFPHQLSGGMQQRVSLCRALIHNPKMLLLDEPFGALDTFTKEDLWATLKLLHRTHKFNVVMVTHDLKESVFMADSVYVMSKRHGRIVAQHNIGCNQFSSITDTYSTEFINIERSLREQLK